MAILIPGVTWLDQARPLSAQRWFPFIPFTVRHRTEHRGRANHGHAMVHTLTGEFKRSYASGESTVVTGRPTMVRSPHQGECGVTRNPWNVAGWVYDSETNTLSGREQEG